MKILAKLGVVVFAMLIELAIIQFAGDLLLKPGHGMMADAKYRRTERLAAFMEYYQRPSPETKAKFQEEMRLMHKHEDWKWEVPLCLFVLANTVAFSFYFRHRSRKNFIQEGC